MNNSLSRKASFTSVLKFTFPTICMMIFMSMYTIVDGIFVARFVSTTALSAVNIVYPMYSVVIGIGIMLATGGSAIVARMMGEGKGQEARQYFTMLVVVAAIMGIVFCVLGFLFLDPILRLLGATDTILPFAHDYLFGLLFFMTMTILQIIFQYFFVTAGKPGLGLVTTIISGLTNIVLDYVFIVVFDMGIIGAAYATGLGATTTFVFGLYYFWKYKNGSLYFEKFTFHFKFIKEACINGSSEMVSNLANSITTLLFNIQMLSLVGDDGVAAITIILYSQFLLNAIYLGYSSGVGALLAYNYGEKNIVQLKRLFKISLIFILATSGITFIVARVIAPILVGLFSANQPSVYELALRGMELFSYSFIIIGFNIFASGLFTSLSNGKISAIISFFRTFIVISVFIMVLPMVLGVDGIWLALPFAEMIALIISITFVVKNRKKYHYY